VVVLIDYLGQTDVSELGPSVAYCSSTGLMWAWVPWWLWCRLGIAPDSTTWVLWQSHQQKYLERVEGRRRNENFAYSVSLICQRIFTCRKILRHGSSGFASHPKEDVLRIFIALKNPSPQPVFNPRPLCPVASTVTTAPPRRRCNTGCRKFNFRFWIIDIWHDVHTKFPVFLWF
jgi:hypothetical protein